MVRADTADGESYLHGVVAQDGSEAAFTWARLGTSVPVQVGRVAIPGLAAHRMYRIRIREEVGQPVLHERAPEWFRLARDGQLLMSGATLDRLGLSMPTLQPQQAMLLHLTAV